MNYMHPEMHRRADVLRTRIEYDSSGMVFIESAEPKILLSLKMNEAIQSDIERGIKGAFQVTKHRQVEVYYAGNDGDDFLWAVIPAEELISNQAA